MRSMSASPSSQFFFPRFFLNARNHFVASMSCTLPFLRAGFRFVSTHTYVAMPVL